MGFDNTTSDFVAWNVALSKLTSKTPATTTTSTESSRIQRAYENAIKQGPLRMRPTKGGDFWEERYFILTFEEMIVLDKVLPNPNRKILEVFRIFPSCSVFETNLGPFAFELVTSEKVLHVMSDSKETTTGWITALRDVIFHSQPEANDPLLQAALKKIDEDTYYQVEFREDKPLGVVLERTGEWAVVKLSNHRDTNVYIGSALVEINGASVTLLTYQQTIEKLKNWKPPLRLGFRRAPHRAGFLIKQARSQRSGNRKVWKQRFFILDEGRLMYKENDSPEASLKGDVPLMGSAVSLVSETESGKPFCFRLVSGVTCLIMQAASADEAMDWAAILYHAIAIANGGAHLLAVERERASLLTIEKQKAEEAEYRRRKEQEEAEEAQREEMRRIQLQQEEEARVAEEERRAALLEQERLQLEQQGELFDKALSEQEKRDAEITAATEEPEIPVNPDSTALEVAIEVVNKVLLPPAPPTEEELGSEPAPQEKVPTEGDVGQLSVDIAELELATAVKTALSDTSRGQGRSVEDLMQAIERAKWAGADSTKVEASLNLLVHLKKERSVREDVTRMLKFAILYKSFSALSEALMAAVDAHLTDLELYAEAFSLFSKMSEEKKRFKEEEAARLAKEAAELDARLEEEKKQIEKDNSEDEEDDHFPRPGIDDSDDESVPAPLSPVCVFALYTNSVQIIIFVSFSLNIYKGETLEPK